MGHKGFKPSGLVSMLLAARQLSAAIGKALITLPTCHLGVDHIGRIQFKFTAHNHKEQPSLSPHSARCAVVLLYSLQEFFGWSEVLTGTQKFRSSNLAFLSCTQISKRCRLRCPKSLLVPPGLRTRRLAPATLWAANCLRFLLDRSGVLTAQSHPNARALLGLPSTKPPFSQIMGIKENRLCTVAQVPMPPVLTCHAAPQLLLCHQLGRKEMNTLRSLVPQRSLELHQHKLGMLPMTSSFTLRSRLCQLLAPNREFLP